MIYRFHLQRETAEISEEVVSRTYEELKKGVIETS
jgi:hypothetical protein